VRCEVIDEIRQIQCFVILVIIHLISMTLFSFFIVILWIVSKSIARVFI